MPLDSVLKENTQLKEQHHVFFSREEAGVQLAEMAGERWHTRENAMVLAIPSGGVPVGLVMARELQLPLDLAIVRKLQIPGNTEAGFGAMTLDGRMFLNEGLMRHLDLGEQDVQAQRSIVAEELKRRNELFRKGRPLPDFSDKAVLVADDGLASGYSMLAAVHMLRDKGAAEVAVALPTAPLRSLRALEGVVDAIYCANLHSSPGPFAVANAYKHWRDLDAAEVVAMLEAATSIAGLPSGADSR